MGPTGLKKLTRCVLDGGKQSGFIAKSLIDDLNLEIVDRRDLVVSAFESQSSESSPRRIARFRAKSTWNNTTVPITAFESTHVFCPQPNVSHDITTVAQTRKLHLADPREKNEFWTSVGCLNKYACLHHWFYSPRRLVVF